MWIVNVKPHHLPRGNHGSSNWGISNSTGLYVRPSFRTRKSQITDHNVYPVRYKCNFVHLHDSVQRKKVGYYSGYIRYIQEPKLHVTLRTVHDQRNFSRKTIMSDLSVAYSTTKLVLPGGVGEILPYQIDRQSHEKLRLSQLPTLLYHHQLQQNQTPKHCH